MVSIEGDSLAPWDPGVPFDDVHDALKDTAPRNEGDHPFVSIEGDPPAPSSDV